MYIRTRNDLIKYLEQYAGWPCIRRAIIEGEVENYGAFNNCWIIKVISKFKKEWIIKINPLLDEKFFGTVLIKDIPWSEWIGDQSQNKLYQGDNPLLYKELRNNARQTKK
jgi:hypothetical protein